jgi:hypothetical protein
MANIASGNTEKKESDVNYCFKEMKAAKLKGGSAICDDVPPGPLTVQTPSMLLAAKASNCTAPTPAQFALYPKVAIPCSVRTQALVSKYANCPTPQSAQRFSQYTRFTPPAPCQPLPQSANTAGISKPSTRLCNL